MRTLKEGEYLTTVEEYRESTGLSYESIAYSCPKCTKQNVSLAIKGRKLGTRNQVMLQVEELTDDIKWAFTVHPVFGYKDD